MFCEEHDLGKVWPADNGYQCFPHAPGLVRRPDVSFVKKGRLPGDVSPDGWVKIPPDLAVEVVSPNDSVEELEEKLDDYRKAGVPLVWVIYPEAAHGEGLPPRRPGPVLLKEDDELSGEDIIPGFRCPLREILPRPTPAAEAAGARSRQPERDLIGPRGSVTSRPSPSKSCSAYTSSVPARRRSMAATAARAPAIVVMQGTPCETAPARMRPSSVRAPLPLGVFTIRAIEPFAR